MELTAKNIIHLPVITKNNSKLGVVKDIIINCDTGVITTFIVRSNPLIQPMTGKELLITFDQVVRITANAVIVEDALVSQEVLLATAA